MDIYRNTKVSSSNNESFTEAEGQYKTTRHYLMEHYASMKTFKDEGNLFELISSNFQDIA